MKPKERVLCALNFQKPDRVPIDLHNFLVCAELMGLPYDEVFSDPALIAESQIKGVEIFGHDMVLVEAGVATLAQSCGCEIEHSHFTAPWVKKPLFSENSSKEISNIVRNTEPPDPSKTNALKTIIDAVKILVDKKGDGLFIMGMADQGPFSLACQLRGIDKFLMDLALEEDYIPELLEFTSIAYFEFANALLEAGAHATSMGESIAGPDVVSPDYYRKYAYKYEKRVIEKLNRKGYIVSNHICGKVDEIITDMVATGADILEIDHKTNLAMAIKKSANKTCLLGPVNPVTFRNANLKQIRDETEQVIKTIKGNYGFIIGPGCALAGDTRIENIKTFVETVKELGKYD